MSTSHRLSLGLRCFIAIALGSQSIAARPMPPDTRSFAVELTASVIRSEVDAISRDALKCSTGDRESCDRLNWRVGSMRYPLRYQVREELRDRCVEGGVGECLAIERMGR